MDTLVRKVIEYGIERPDKWAVACKGKELRYGELARYVIGTARVLKNMGIQKGKHVLFTAVSKPEMAVVYLALQYVGAVSVFADKNATQASDRMIYEESDAVLYITDKPMKVAGEACRLYSMKKLCDEGKEAVKGGVDLQKALENYELPERHCITEMLFTTGTTGRPKGVMLSANAVYHIFLNTIQGIGIREDEILLEPLPLNHSFALRVFRAVLYQGATLVLQNGFAFAGETEWNIEHYRCTAFATVPASLEIICSQMKDQFAKIMGRLRYMEVGAGSLTVEQRKRYARLLPNTTIYNVWGSSETGGALFVNVSEVAADPRRVAATGRPLPGITVSTVDSDGREVATDKEHPARMRLRGDMIMSGYYKLPEQNAEAIKDGWLLTGDMVYTDEEGYVYMLGRADDIINVGGEKVSPVEVENLVSEYEHIRECACIGAGDPEGILGQIPVLFVVPADEAYSDEELTSFLAKRCERYKLPKRYVQLSALPRNRMKKIDRRELQRILDDSSSAIL